MADYRSFNVSQEGQTVLVRMLPFRETVAMTPPASVQGELGRFFSELRGDMTVRVVVLTGAEDGEFQVTPPTDHYQTEAARRRLVDPPAAFRHYVAVVRCHQAMIEIEKPIVARVNGDAIGFGQALMFASDLILAREDARVADVHMGMGEIPSSDRTHTVGPPFGLVPGTGAIPYAPIYMSPAKAKEWLMLSPEVSAGQLAADGLINRAVPMAKLDSVVEETVRALLRRSPYALAWTKRLANRHLAEHLNLTLDAGMGLELVNFLQFEREGSRDSL